MIATNCVLSPNVYPYPIYVNFMAGINIKLASLPMHVVFSDIVFIIKIVYHLFNLICFHKVTNSRKQSNTNIFGKETPGLPATRISF